VINHHLGSDRDWDVTGLGAEFLPQVPGEQLAGDAVVKLGHGSLCLHPTLLNLVGPEERQVISQEVLEGRAISDKFGCQVMLQTRIAFQTNETVRSLRSTTLQCTKA